MASGGEARRRGGFGLSVGARVALIPVVFAVLGLVVRYLAYRQGVPHPALGQFPDALCRWDCFWYEGIARGGYSGFPAAPGTTGNWAFFPFYPTLIALVRVVVHGPLMVVATSLSILASIAAAMLAWPLLERNWRAYTLYSAFLLCGPFSVYFTTFYTEVAFVLLTNGVFLALRRSNYLAAGLVGGLLSATRIVGVFIVFAIVVQGFVAHRRTGGRLASFVPAVVRQPRLVLAVFLAPLGLFAYMAWLYFKMGDALAFQHVQRAFGRGVGNPLVYLWRGLTHVDPTGALLSVPQQAAIATLVGLALCGVLVWRNRYPEAVFCVICLILPLFAGLHSMVRFVAALSPLMLVLMALLGRFRSVMALALVVFVVGDYYCTLGWLTGNLSLV